jgi:AraC-like DNA-binding protein
MNYEQLPPPGDLSRFIKCFWVVEDAIDAEMPLPQRQKIIPDGYTEIIFHFGDPYRICLRDRWETQADTLLAGQIKKYFYLENTGRSSIFGIKLRPSALTQLFGLEMSSLTDRVLHIREVPGLKQLLSLHDVLQKADAESRCIILSDFFRSANKVQFNKHPVEVALETIFARHGMVTIGDVASEGGFTERYLEQLFKKYVGITPKYFARIVRFNYIFHLIADPKPDWADLTFRAGFYDQSHFIRNFKSFTGEDPSKYLFSRPDLANFFLKPDRRTA